MREPGDQFAEPVMHKREYSVESSKIYDGRLSSGLTWFIDSGKVTGGGDSLEHSK